MQLSSEINRLIKTGKEGAYWDFKRQHHTKNDELLHDVLCLANAEHDGDRFLIFGIEDGSTRPRDLSTDKIRRTQADILDFLKSNQRKFAENRWPDVRLEKVVVESCEIDVLVIANSQKKPFYLIDNFQNIKPYHIYSRVEDTNTPKDKSASPHQIELMWRERFGLDQPPLRRVKTFLTDFEGWSNDTQDSGNGMWWYKVFPEFTIQVEDSPFDSKQEWTRGEVVKDQNFSSLYSLYYHQTRLARIHWVSFDDRKKSIVAPKWEPCLTGRLYYFERGSIELAMQLFHAHHNGGDFSKCLRGPAGSVEIPLASAEEIVDFLTTQASDQSHEVSTDQVEQYGLFLENQKAFQKWKSKTSRQQKNL